MPGAAQVGVHDHRLERVGGQLAGRLGGPAGDLGVAEPVERLGRLEEVVAAAEHEPVGRLRRCAAAGRPARRASRTSACRRVISWPASPRTVKRSQPTRFWPKSTSVRPDGEVQISTGRRLSCRTTGGPTYGASRCHVEVAATSTPTQPSGAGPGPQPGVVAQPRVDGLAVVEVVGQGLRRPRRPALVGDHELPVPVGEVDLELGDQRRAGRRRRRGHRSSPGVLGTSRCRGRSPAPTSRAAAR